MVTLTKADAAKKAGFDHKNADVDPLNRYWTPRCATEALLRACPPLTRVVWDPCCGAGHITRVIPLEYRIVASDLDTGPHVVGEPGVDFLGKHLKDGVFPDLAIITNPPFKHWDGMFERACSLARYVAFLGRLNVLCAVKREKMFKKLGNLHTVVLTRRLPYRSHAMSEWKPGGTVHAWFVWRRGMKGFTVDWATPDIKRTE